MVINGVELELDLLDADVAKKWETECQRVKDRVADKARSEKSNADMMLYQCEVIDDFFDCVFGDGTSQKLFEGNHHLGKRVDAFALAVGEAHKAGEQIKTIGAKYFPQNTPNRAARRKHKKDRGNMPGYLGSRP